MESEFLNTDFFELPKSPALTENDSDDDVQFVGSYPIDRTTYPNISNNWHTPFPQTHQYTNVIQTNPQTNVVQAHPHTNPPQTHPYINVTPTHPYINMEQTRSHTNIPETHQYTNATPTHPYTNVPPTYPYTNMMPTHPQMAIPYSIPLLATPPLSPQDINQQQQPDMPLLTALLSNNRPPAGFLYDIPCFVCHQRFNDLESLKQHLTAHADQWRLANIYPTLEQFVPPYPGAVNVIRYGLKMPDINEDNINNTPVEAEAEDSNNNQQLEPVAVGASVITEDCSNNNQQLMPPQPDKFICERCGMWKTSELELNLHQRRYHSQYMSPEKMDSKSSRPYKCHLCKKGYKRHGNLQKHVEIRHCRQANNDAAGIPPIQGEPETASTSTSASTSASAEAVNAIQPRVVWSTKMLNAVAAANYSPANESAEKYLPPTQVSDEQFEASIRRAPKQKYPPRSPYFNPNLWVDCADYVP